MSGQEDPRTDRIELRTDLTAARSMWIAVRALGERQEPSDMIVAHSAPIFVLVDGAPFWKAEAVPALVELHRAKLQELFAVPIEPDGDLESWETRELLLAQWEKQRSELEPRIREADARYRALLERVRESSGR